MDVAAVKLPTLFRHSVRFEMPAGQRPYVWDQERHWEPVWNDVRFIAEGVLTGTDTHSELRSTRNDKRSSHFFGAVVIHRVPTRTGHVERPKVVDGQQRLTTFQLLLKSAERIFKAYGHDRAGRRIQLWTKNDDAIVNEPGDEYKIWPTPTDQASFRTTMEEHLEAQYNDNSLINRAAIYFYQKMEDWFEGALQGVQDNSVRDNVITSTCRGIRTRPDRTEGIELVAIDVEESDDPHVIFETLNARGTSLSESDLVKNDIMAEAFPGIGTSPKEEDVAAFWPFETPWWRRKDHTVSDSDSITTIDKVDQFLKYWIIMCKAEDVKSSAIFDNYKQYREQPALELEDIVQRLKHSANRFQALVDPSIEFEIDPSVYQRANRLRVMSSWDLTPVLLRLNEAGWTDRDRDFSLWALDSYLTRRKVCKDRVTSGPAFQQFLMGMLRQIQERHHDEALFKIVVEYLKETSVTSNDNRSTWPDTSEFREEFRTYSAYTSIGSRRVREILIAIERAMAARLISESMGINVDDLTIEHILPQAWADQWGQASYYEVTGLQTSNLANNAGGYTSPDEAVEYLDMALTDMINEIHDIPFSDKGDKISEDFIDNFIHPIDADMPEYLRNDIINLANVALGESPTERMLGAVLAKYREHCNRLQDQGEQYEQQFETVVAENVNLWLHTFGNLTLVRGELNQELGASSWMKKREALEDNSTLALTKDLLNNHIYSTWTVEAIERRAERLFEYARRIWPSYEEIVRDYYQS